MASYIRQDAMNLAVLFQLFELAQLTDNRVSPEEIAKRFKVPIGAKRIQLALEHLDDDELVSYFIQTSRASINRKGYKYVEDELQKEDSFIALYALQGDEWLGSQTLAQAGVPASDRIVSRSDNQQQIEEIAAGIDELVVELKQDNEVGAALGDDRDLIISEANASKELVRGDRFRVARLAQLLVPALKFLADKFGGGAIGELAKRLVSLIVALF
jgi:hypothetical protein